MCSNFWLENSKFWFAIGRHSLSLNASFTCFCVMCDIQPWTNTAKTGVFINNPRYDPICFTIVANCFTGHSKLWSVAHCFIVLFFSSFFWDLNVRETLSARWSLELLWGMMLPSLKKAMFLRVSCLVCCWSWFGTFRYLHNLQAKNKAPMISWLIASGRSFAFFNTTSLMTQIGRIFSCTAFGSSFVCVRYCLA